MKSKQHTSLIFLFAVTILVMSSIVVKSTTNTAVADDKILSDNQIGYISQYCDSIKSSLKRLAVSDSRTRTYFGGIYETASSKFITPLNLRLVKNNLSNPDLIDLQSSYAETRANFSLDFIAYSKTLEELTTMDCKNEPEEFYRKLESARSKREKVKNDLISINELLESHISTVNELKEALDE